MALVEWKQEYSVGIVQIDDQHKKLAGLVNTMHDSIKSGRGKEAIGGILNELIAYTQYHFSTEEKYFDIYNYPDSEEHKKQHRDLVNKVSELQNRFNSGEGVMTMEVMNFLRDWLNDHIIGSDTKFGPFLNEKGIQ